MHSSLLDASLWLTRQGPAFGQDERGASTIEMVIMMAAGISLTLSMTDLVTQGVENVANEIKIALTDFTISTSFEKAPEGEAIGVP